MERHIGHSISLIRIELVGFVLIVTGRRSDLQKVGAAVAPTASVQPVPTQVPAHILVLGFRVDTEDFGSLHILRQHDMLDHGAFADTGHTHDNEAAVGAVVPACPGVQNHQPATAVLGKIIAPAVAVTGACEGETAHKGTHGNDAGNNAVHRPIGGVGGRNALKPLLLQIGKGTDLAFLNAERALHTAADFGEGRLVLRHRHHRERHHGDGFALLVDLLHDMLPVLGGLLRPLTGQRVFGAVGGAPLLDNALGEGGDQGAVVNRGDPHRHNGAGDVCDFGEPAHLHLLRIADRTVDLSHIFTDHKAVPLDFQPHRGNDIQQRFIDRERFFFLLGS